LQHFDAFGVRGMGAALFERLDGRWHEPDLIQRRLFVASPRQCEVAVMHGLPPKMPRRMKGG
jgi:hypothetical protein